MELAVQIAVGSSTQIALFVAPVLVFAQSADRATPSRSTCTSPGWRWWRVLLSVAVIGAGVPRRRVELARGGDAPGPVPDPGPGLLPRGVIGPTSWPAASCRRAPLPSARRRPGPSRPGARPCRGRCRHVHLVDVFLARPEPDATVPLPPPAATMNPAGWNATPHAVPWKASFGLSCFGLPSFQSNSDHERVADPGEGVRHVRDAGTRERRAVGRERHPAGPADVGHERRVVLVQHLGVEVADHACRSSRSQSLTTPLRSHDASRVPAGWKATL